MSKKTKTKPSTKPAPRSTSPETMPGTAKYGAPQVEGTEDEDNLQFSRRSRGVSMYAELAEICLDLKPGVRAMVTVPEGIENPSKYMTLVGAQVRRLVASRIGNDALSFRLTTDGRIAIGRVVNGKRERTRKSA